MLAKRIKDQGSKHSNLPRNWIVFVYLRIAFPLSLDSQTKMSPYSSFTSWRIWHTWFFFYTKTGNKRRLVNIKKVTSWRNYACNILSALHAFTGCGTISTFVRKGETTNLLISLVSLMFISLGRSSDMPHHTWNISCACYTISIQPLWYKRFASCKVCRKIHSKTKKGTFNLQWIWYQPSTTMQKCIKHPKGELMN